MTAAWAIDGVWGAALMSVPWIVLAFVIWNSGREMSASRAQQGSMPLAGPRAKERDVRSPPMTASAPVFATSRREVHPQTPLEDEGSRHVALHGSGADGAAVTAMAQAGVVPAKRAPAELDLPPPISASAVPEVQDQPVHVADTVAEAAALQARFAQAREAGDLAALASVSLALARLAARNGARAEALTFLREAVAAATTSGRVEDHAAARLDLADFAVAEGDMTTACEHWQMAKVLFHDMGRRREQDQVAETMRQARCPTDWFLTQF